MKRTTISLPPELQEKLRLEAARRGVSMATLIREGVEGLANKPPSNSPGADNPDTDRQTSDLEFGPKRNFKSAGVSSTIESRMTRVIDALPVELRERLEAAAKERHSTLEHFILFALEDKAAFLRPKPKSIGKYRSGFTDTAFRSGEEPAIPEPWR